MGWRLWLEITATISSSNYRPFRGIGSWLTFITALPSILGCLLKSSTVSSSRCRPVRSLGLWVIFSTSSSDRLGAMTPKSLLVVLSMPVKEKYLSYRLSLWSVSMENWGQAVESSNTIMDEWGPQSSSLVTLGCLVVLGHGCLLSPPSSLDLGVFRELTPSPHPVEYKSGVLGRGLFFLPPPRHTRPIDIDISAGGDINAYEGKWSLLSPLT